MTEMDWLESDDPELLLAELLSHSVRKFRLTAVACCMREPGRSTLQRACKVAEAFADGKTTPDRLRRAELTAEIANDCGFGDEIAATLVLNRSFTPAITQDIFRCMQIGCLPSTLEANAALVRDIFGNPFRPVALDLAWLTSTVVQLAEGIYEDRAFDRMPILADALQDAGCDNEDILEHCRGEGPHVRGCWLIDLLLGKE